LKSLDISHTQVTNNGLQYLVKLRSLEELVLGGNKISGVGLHALRTLPKLTRLDLSGFQKRNSGTWSVALTDNDLEMIASMTGLQDLNLSGTRITDLGIGRLKTLRELRSLDLSRTAVTASGLKELVGLTKLERLSLWKASRINDAGAPVLTQMKGLVALDVSETAMTDAGREQLRSIQGLRDLYVQ
jgi:Leucine-rich repeat (LRR) protein